MFSQNNTLQSNKVFHNQDDGIVFKEMDNNAVQDNVVYNNRTGISMDNANNNKVTGNLLAANLTGLDFTAGSDYNLFTRNSWERNQEQVNMTDPGHNRWDDGQQGNYWSDYTGNDFNNDGIGDEPYWQNNLSEYLVKQFPMVKLLFNSPALQAVAAAEKAFPVLHPPGAVDNFPLVVPSVNSTGLPISWQPNFSAIPSEQDDLMGM
jgi:nitrous oxidase accessory protein